MTQIIFTILVDLERETGKFAQRDELVESIRETLEQADPGSVDGVGADATSVYTVVGWDVEEQARLPRPSRTVVTWHLGRQDADVLHSVLVRVSQRVKPGGRLGKRVARLADELAAVLPGGLRGR